MLVSQAMPTPTDEDNKAFNRSLQDIESSYSDNDPDGHNAEGPLREIQGALALLWKAVGGEVNETWQQEQERLYGERAQAAAERALRARLKAEAWR